MATSVDHILQPVLTARSRSLPTNFQDDLDGSGSVNVMKRFLQTLMPNFFGGAPSNHCDVKRTFSHESTFAKPGSAEDTGDPMPVSFTCKYISREDNLSCVIDVRAACGSESPFAVFLMSATTKPINVAEVRREEFHAPNTRVRSPPSRPRVKEPLKRTDTTLRPGVNTDSAGLKRVDTLGVSSLKAHREVLLSSLQEEQVTPISISAGQTGSVFALESGGKKIAVFKPLSGEKFSRKCIVPTQGGVREEAVYLVDRYCGRQACVPVTARAAIEVQGNKQQGSVQAFVEGAVGFIGDFGMSRDIAEAVQFFTQETAEALALLDMRVFNTDRHEGNLLVVGEERPVRLVPIDHGCCLPPWFALSEACFDAWISWPHLKSVPSKAARELAQIADEKLEETCTALRSIGLEEASIITLMVCTRFIYIGVVELNVPLARLASLMLRDWGAEFFSWLEDKVFECAPDAGCNCHVDDEDGDPKLVLEGGDLDVPEFLDALSHKFRSEMLETLKQQV